MRSSTDWLHHFEQNRHALLEIPWEAGPELDPAERRAVARSIAEFQRGESSEGRHLLRYAQEYSEASGDRDYFPAIRLFIAEEQRHARDLARFMVRNGLPLAERSFADSAFRRLRNLLGTLEVSIAVLIQAEIVAQVYYAALQKATDSRVLRRLCEQILQDEAHHVRFQAEQLGKLRAARGPFPYAVTRAAERLLFLGTFPVVWMVHAAACRRGGYGFRRYWCSAWDHFRRAFATSNEARRACRDAAPAFTRRPLPQLPGRS